MKSPDLLDRAASQLREEPLDVAAAQSAARRVWSRLEEATGAAPAGAAVAESHVLDGCADFRSLLPSLAAGTLAAERRLLVEDHLRECANCRRAYLALRDPGAVRPFVSRASRTGRSAFAPPRWALAAGLALAVLGAAFWLGPLLPLFGGSRTLATVESIDGQLLRLEGDRAAVVAAGATLPAGVAVRASGASTAVLRLADGSRLEIAPRSEVAVSRSRDGLRVDLARGNVILEAAKQHDGHLYVRTADCQVSVVGTIFAVHSGPVGSRVAVLEGEVRVKHGGDLDVLHPGDRVATGVAGSSAGRISLREEFLWSRNAADYNTRLAALAALGQELEGAVANPALRTSTRLLDLAPAGTVVFAAAPNTGEAVGRAWRLVRERVTQSPALAAWWQEEVAGSREAEMSRLVERFERFGTELGPEIALAVRVPNGSATQHPDFVAFAEVPRPAALATLVAAEIAAASANGATPHVRLVADPQSLSGATGEELLLWIGDGLFVASPSPAMLREAAATAAGAANPFVASPFRATLAASYARGAGWLLAFDGAALVTRASSSTSATSPEAAQHLAAFERTGFADLGTVVVESRDLVSGTENGAHVDFVRPRRGMAAWLEAASPMGALDFVSPEATFAAGALLEEPGAMLEDLLAIAEGSGEGDVRSKLAAFEREHGVALSSDLAGSLGGEIAFAIDGPVLPVPTWKLVVEVLDESRLLAGIGDLVSAFNREAVANGQPELRLSQEAVDGRVFHRLARAGATSGPAVEFTFVNGYLLAGPDRAALRRTLAQHETGLTLPSSQAFRGLLAASAPGDLSAVAYQNFGAVLGSLSGAGEVLSGQLAELSALASVAAERGPSLGWAVAEPTSITVGTSGAPGPLALALEGWLYGSAMRGHASGGGSDAASGAATGQPAEGR